MSAGILELVLAFLGLLGGLGVPLASPPGEEDPRMLAVAPDDCLLYYSWNETVEPKAERNPTEAFLCRPTVKTFLKKFRTPFKLMLSSRTSGKERFTFDHDLIVDILAAVENQPGAIYFDKIKRGGDRFLVDEFQGGLVLRLGNQADKLRLRFADRLKKLTPENSVTEHFVLAADELDGTPVLHLRRIIPSNNGIKLDNLWVCLADDLLQLASSKVGLQKLQTNLTTPPPAWLKQLRKDLAIDRVASTSYLDWRAVNNEFKPFLNAFNGSKETIWLESLDGVQSSGSVSGYDDQGFINQTRLSVAANRPGLFSLVDQRGMKVEKLNWLHKDRLIGIAIPMEAKKTFQVIQKIAEDAKAGDALNQVMKDVEKFTGRSFQEEVLASLGDIVTFQYGLEDGSPFSWRVDIEIKEEMSFPDVLDQISNKLTDIAGDTMRGEVLKTEVDGRTIYQYEVAQTWVRTVTWGFDVDRLTIKTGNGLPFGKLAPEDRMVNSTLAKSIFKLAKRREWGSPVALSQFNFSGAIWKYRWLYESFRDQDGWAWAIEKDGPAKFSQRDLPTAEDLAKDVAPNVSAIFAKDNDLILVQRSIYPSNSIVGSMTTLFLGSIPSWLID